jgi:dihydrolipoamide dehydrogenase
MPSLLILGGGPAGYVAAIRAAQLGFTTTCVEREPALGGTCLRVGCIPSKALLESSEIYTASRHALERHGVLAGPVQLDLGRLLKRKDDVVNGLTKGIDGLLKKNNVTRIEGHARFTGPGAVSVTTASGETRSLSADHIVVATGSRPSSLPGIEIDGSIIGTSTEALSYPSVPEHLVVIGAGYIGLELGSVWARLGAKVTVVEYLDRILPGMDREIADEAQKLLGRQGLDFRLGHKVQSARVEDGKGVVRCEGRDPIIADRVLVAVGRIPNTQELGLETTGIQLDPRGRIEVDPHFRTSVAGHYAIGDVIKGPMLAHKAEEEGVACVEFIAGKHGHVDYDTIPGVCYTHPEIASVGKTEEQLKESGTPYKKGVFHYRANGRAHALAETDGRAKILTHATTDRILGVHIIGARAGDLIAEAVVAMSFHASAEDLARCSHAHPTLAEILKEAALATDGRALHS